MIDKIDDKQRESKKKSVAPFGPLGTHDVALGLADSAFSSSHMADCS